ncbi:MAG: choice-of-anchor L domain-containing protein, partial [Bacteroidota bacterium]
MLRFLPFLFFFMGACSLAGQTLEVINEDPYTPATLIESVFLGEGIDIINVDYVGDDRSAAYFTGGQNFVGIDRGVVMTTGITVSNDNDNGVDAIGSVLSNVNSNSPLNSDPDLNAILNENGGGTLNDITVYTITFRPLSDTVSFRYVFASEEYPEYVCSQFNDIFGFFLSGPGINGPYSNNGINIAKIPGTDLPVRINTINHGEVGANGIITNCTPPSGTLVHSDLYNNNTDSPEQPVYDGLTNVLSATSPVQACEVYTMKIIIADVGDPLLDSGVFLEARSFGGEATNLEIVNLAIDGVMVEGCGDVLLHFHTPEPVENDQELVVEFFGDATPGVDYTAPPTNLTIPAGDSLLVVPLTAFEDNIDDDGENIFISLQRSDCLTDTFTISIGSNRLGEMSLLDEIVLCGEETVALDATVANSDPVTYSFSNDEEETWIAGTRFFDINVQGVIPQVNNPFVLQAICIDEIEHIFPRELELYAINPNGVFVELSTRNGGNPPNSIPFSGYLGTCFTPTATTRIAPVGGEADESLVPFTGDWIPEGPLSDLWFGQQPTNGIWQLRVRDRGAIFN